MNQQADILAPGDADAVMVSASSLPPTHPRDDLAVTESWFRRADRVLWRRRGDLRWDVMVRTGGIVALLAIPVVVLLPSSIPLVAFGLISLPINGPLSPLLPTAWEPLIVQTSVYSSAWSVTLVGLCAYMYMEYINWYIYAWLFRQQRLLAVRRHRWTQWAIRTFGRAPFATVIFFAFAPLPFWVVRIIAILDRYSVGRFMVATTIGRIPRIFFYAWIGATFSIPTVLLVIVGAGIPLALIVMRLVRGQRLLPDDNELLGGQSQPDKSD